MGTGQVVDVMNSALWIVIIVSAPMLLLGLTVGLIVSIFQATTQIQEQTLAFIPKILAIFIGLALFGGWMMTKLIDFTRAIFINLSNYIG